MQTAFLLLGSNLGNRLHYLQQAIQLITTHCGQVVATSSVYQTAAWGVDNQPPYYNQCICIETQLHPESLMETLLDIEQQLHRTRSTRYASRTIDIDILLIDGLVWHTPLLQVPHPRMHLRRFALEPLHEIAAQVRCPQTGLMIKDLLIHCQDSLLVQKISA